MSDKVLEIDCPTGWLCLDLANGISDLIPLGSKDTEDSYELLARWMTLGEALPASMADRLART